MYRVIEGAKSEVVDRERAAARKHVDASGLAQLLVHYGEDPTTLDYYVKRVEWIGPAHLPVRIDEQWRHYAREKGQELKYNNWPDVIKFLDWPLRFVSIDAYSLAAIYARTDAGRVFTWTWWYVSSRVKRASRWFYYRLMMTLVVWGLAYRRPDSEPSWRDIGRRRHDGATLPVRLGEFIRRARAKLTRQSWGPCPLCGRAFAGFEASPIRLIMKVATGPDNSLQSEEKIACDRCTDKADKANQKKFGISYVSSSQRSLEISHEHIVTGGE